jgi:hypothetical protein
VRPAGPAHGRERISLRERAVAVGHRLLAEPPAPPAKCRQRGLVSLRAGCRGDHGPGPRLRQASGIRLRHSRLGGRTG